MCSSLFFKICGLLCSVSRYISLTFLASMGTLSPLLMELE
jgi:hypothetical protein